jgi:ABC-type multidrug transport system permease subunit
VRWLLLKDLQILRRSPLLVALLVIYPVAIAVLIGLALSAGPDKPKVAFVNLVPPEKNEISLGGQTLDASRYAGRLFEAVEPVRVRSRAAAIEKVRSGEVLGALILPADLTDKLQGSLGLTGGERPRVEVIYNAEDPVKRRYVESLIESRLSDANLALSGELTKAAGAYLGILLRGGDVPLIGNVLGLERTKTIIDATIAGLPEDAPERAALRQVSSFARAAIDNLDLSDEILASVSEPVRVRKTVLEGSKTPLEAFAVAVSAAISLMFITLLLASGMLALEREENTFARLVRGLVSRAALVAEKIGLAALCASALTLLLLVLLGVFLPLDGSRVLLWLPALALGALAFAAMGVAIGALTREVRTASLLAFGLSLPLAFLGLVPSGAVADALFDVIRIVSGAFPFKPSLEALDAAINGGAMGIHLLHLALLTIAFGALARFSLRRFG